MARNRLKIDNLAKLRQYSPGQDLGEFMQNQFRQIVTALDNAYVDPTDLSGLQSDITSLSNNSKNVNGFYGLTSSVNTTQRITFNSYYDSGSLGTLTTVSGGHLWTPKANGKFWIEANGQFNETGVITGGTVDYSASLSIYQQNGTLIGSTIDSFQYSGFVYVPKSTHGNAAGITNLTTTNGVYFYTTLNGYTLQNLSFKITRIGD